MAAAEEHDTSAVQFRAREVVAVFDSHDNLVSAIQDIGDGGLQPHQMNLLTGRQQAEEKLGHKVDDVTDLAQEGQAPVGHLGRSPRTGRGQDGDRCGLAYIGSIAAIGAVVATGGGLAAAIAAAIAAGGTGGAVGAWLGSFIDSGQANRSKASWPSAG